MKAPHNHLLSQHRLFSLPCPRRSSLCILTGAPFSQDPHVDQYEAKEWTFVIENVSGWGGLEPGVSGTLGQH